MPPTPTRYPTASPPSRHMVTLPLRSSTHYIRLGHMDQFYHDPAPYIYDRSNALLTSRNTTPRILALPSRYLILMYKAAICHLRISIMLLAILYYFPCLWQSTGRAGAFAGHHLGPLVSVVSTPVPRVGPARPTCNHLLRSSTS
jgi:hypothetical protein